MSDERDRELAARLEAGRKLFARQWRLLWAATDAGNLPPSRDVEVAFAGRSNVGKSSLINALVGQRALARTSSAPGRTRQLNFFGADAGLTLVDMPGYGFARAPKTEIAAWTNLAFAFLRGRPNLRRVYLLVDARHGLKPNDLDALTEIGKAAVSCQVVLTKADEVTPADLAAVLAASSEAIAKRAAAHPETIVTSAESGAGIDGLRAEIAALI
ncbi:MAG TPA: ribosome biogenesis GTP-binding protein YihA/YsxC [Bauldia sp.]|nr:ribosome biogenesis GTP-binding protein YihA/YsxC [Bauldia sp.]